ncbi:MAG: antirestriction protein ArdA [Oscillospiraceae bacterium]|nr:antirestriction protein ArdA [Oscillospiraceae bacterium]
MSYVIKAVLSNPGHPEHGQITIPFPIPDEQYDQTIEMLQAMDLGFSRNRDCTVDDLDSYYGVLEALKDTMVNVDQLDYLAKRLDSFDGGEAAQFQAMAHKLELAHIKDFINLTFCCQQATVITSFSDLDKIGKDHRMTLNGGTMPMEEYQAVDGRKEALELIKNHQGIITPYGVVYDNGMEMAHVYNGRQFPGYLYGGCVMMLQITPKYDLKENQNPEYLYLPAPDKQIERAMLRAGIDRSTGVQMRLDFDELPEKVAEALDLKSLSGDDLPGLNRMCRAIAPMEDADTEKLNAVVQMAKASDITAICQMAENLDQFDFIPGIQTPAEYGRYMIQQSGHFEYDANLESFYNYQLYGEQSIREENGQFNECGYVAYHGTLLLEELMRDDSAEQYQQEQGPQMGGISY